MKMKKNLILIAAIALVGTGTFAVNNSFAGPEADPSQPISPPPGQPITHPMTKPSGLKPRPGRGGLSYHAAVVSLKRAKADLERSKEDFNGHKAAALDAIAKASEELDAIQKIVQAEEAAKAAAAAKAAQAAQSAPDAQPAPAAAPTDKPQ